MLTIAGQKKRVERTIVLKFGRDIASIIMTYYEYEESSELNDLIAATGQKQMLIDNMWEEYHKGAARFYYDGNLVKYSFIQQLHDITSQMFIKLVECSTAEVVECYMNKWLLSPKLSRERIEDMRWAVNEMFDIIHAYEVDTFNKAKERLAASELQLQGLRATLNQFRGL